MSKSSTISARQSPPRDLASSGGRLRIHTETITIETSARVELADLTDRLSDLVRASQAGAPDEADLAAASTEEMLADRPPRPPAAPG